MTSMVIGQQPEPAFTGWYATGRMLRGLAWAAIGFTIGITLTAAIRNLTGRDAFDLELTFTAGYTLALPGWLLGIGMWDRWGREWFGAETKAGPSDWGRYFSFCTDHKVIGIQYLVTFVALFLLSGLLAMLRCSPPTTICWTTRATTT
jgi:cytochrome c oxidase subunit 1